MATPTPSASTTPTPTPTATPTATPTPTPSSTPTPTIAPSGTLDPNWLTHVNYIGRFDQSDLKGPSFAWSASTIQAAFQGTNISIHLAPSTSWESAYLNVKIDNTDSYRLLVDHDGAYGLATGLAAGDHLIEVSRRDEGGFGEIHYRGFALDQGQLLPPPARVDRRIEVIGDSITCGYGNEAPNESTPFTTATENAYLAYGPITARQLNAEAIVIAWSGIGILRNNSGGTANQMPAIYPRTLSKSSAPVWDFTSWVPHVVVVNLGTNDFGTGTPVRADFVRAYRDFIATLRSHYPDAHIFCAVGPMMGGTSLTTAIDYIQGDVVNALASAGDTRIHFIAFPKQNPANGLGADWHPSLKTHQLMADQLTAAIQSTLGW